MTQAQESAKPLQATLQSSRRITAPEAAEVRQIVLGLPEPAYYFPEGQNIGVLVPGPHPFGNTDHLRYYTIAATRATETGCELELLVRRCFYIDEVSGEQYPGIASNYLCDAQPGQTIALTGPHRSPFVLPVDRSHHLLMLGTGTGIAPFRAFLRQAYDGGAPWTGKVRLFYGARTGTEMLYMNDLNADIANYYDQATFEAIRSVSRGVLRDEGDAFGQGVAAHAEEIWRLMQDPNTHVYLAGMEKILPALDAVMSEAAGGTDAWSAARGRLIEAGRWSQLLYH